MGAGDVIQLVYNITTNMPVEVGLGAGIFDIEKEETVEYSDGRNDQDHLRLEGQHLQESTVRHPFACPIWTL